MANKLVVISGPSGCKRAMADALAARMAALYEVPVWVKPAGQGYRDVAGVSRITTGAWPAIEADPDRYVRIHVPVSGMPGEMNVVDLQEVEQALEQHNLVVLVAYAELALGVASSARVQEMAQRGTRVIKVFLSPLPESYLAALGDMCMTAVKSVVFSNLLVRAAAEIAQRKRSASTTPAKGVDRRSTRKMVAAEDVIGYVTLAERAWGEMVLCGQFDHVIPVWNGHLPEAWATDPPQGDAGEALARLCALLQAP